MATRMGPSQEGFHIVSPHIPIVYAYFVCKLTGVASSFWQLATDALPPQDANALAEDLGIEFDTPEHNSLERGSLCTTSGQHSRSNLKRKREWIRV